MASDALCSTAGGNVPNLYFILPNFKCLLKISLTAGWKYLWQCTATYFVCPCPAHSLSSPFRGTGCVIGTVLSWQTPAENSKWIPAVRMIYGVYTDRQLVRNTSDTVYTTRHVCCECLASWHYLGFTLSDLCVFYRGIRSLPTQREKKKIICVVLVRLG